MILSGISCMDSTSPPDPDGKYIIRLYVGGDESMPRRVADTIIYRIRGSADTLTHIALPWSTESHGTTGDSVFLFAWDSYRDTWADSGDGFADFIRIRACLDTNIISCASMYRNLPRYGGWMSTSLCVPDDSSARKVLSYPPEFRPRCDKPM